MGNKIPEFLYDAISNYYEKNIVDQIIDGYTKTRKTTFRVNNLKTNINSIMKNLENNEIELKENINIITGKNEARKIHIIKIHNILPLWRKPK